MLVVPGGVRLGIRNWELGNTETHVHPGDSGLGFCGYRGMYPRRGNPLTDLATASSTKQQPATTDIDSGQRGGLGPPSKVDKARCRGKSRKMRRDTGKLNEAAAPVGVGR